MERKLQRRKQSEKNVWHLILEARRRHDHTQVEAAACCNVIQDTWSRWELKTTAPRITDWKPLAQYCGISPVQLAVSIAENFLS